MLIMFIYIYFKYLCLDFRSIVSCFSILVSVASTDVSFSFSPPPLRGSMGFLEGMCFLIFLMVSVSKQNGSSIVSSFYDYEISVERMVLLIRFSIEFSIWTIIFGTLVANSGIIRLLPHMITSSASCSL